MGGYTIFACKSFTKHHYIIAFFCLFCKTVHQHLREAFKECRASGAGRIRCCCESFQESAQNKLCITLNSFDQQRMRFEKVNCVWEYTYWRIKWAWKPSLVKLTLGICAKRVKLQKPAVWQQLGSGGCDWRFLTIKKRHSLCLCKCQRLWWFSLKVRTRQTLWCRVSQHC